MDNKIKILEIINDATIGGGQVHVDQILSEIDKSRFVPFIACSEHGDFLEKFVKHGARYFPVDIAKNLNVFCIYKIYRILKNNRIDILHTHGGIAGLWGRLAAIFAQGTVVIHTIHGIHFLYYRQIVLQRIYIIIEKFLSKFTTITICVSNSDKKKGLAHKLFDPERCLVIRNGINHASFLSRKSSSSSKIFDFAQGTHLICNVGSLDPVKGQKYLLAAFKLVTETLPNSKLLIIGDGPIRNDLISDSRKLGLENQVKFLGIRTDVREILALCDLFVLTSLWEGLPLSVLEAMTMGKAIVASRIAGIQEIIEDGKEGLLISPENPILIAEAMIKLLQDRSLAHVMGKRAQKKVSEQFRLDIMIKELEKVYSMQGE